MQYIVEMALKPGHTDADWERWKVEMKPPELLMSVPGMLSSQRFKGVTEPLAYYAHYDLASPDVLTSDGYKNVGGGVRVKKWSDHNIENWKRDIADGISWTPEVPEGYVLLVKKAARLDFPDEGLPFIRLTTVGMDKSTPYRGFAIVPASETSRIARHSEIRVYRPVGPQLRKLA